MSFAFANELYHCLSFVRPAFSKTGAACHPQTHLMALNITDGWAMDWVSNLAQTFG